MMMRTLLVGLARRVFIRNCGSPSRLSSCPIEVEASLIMDHSRTWLHWLQEMTIGVNVGEESESATSSTDVRFTTRVVGAEHEDAAGKLFDEPVSRFGLYLGPMVVLGQEGVSVWNIALSPPALSQLVTLTKFTFAVLLHSGPRHPYQRRGDAPIRSNSALR